MANPNDRLDSWKQIADHLGRDVRTTMRWERERGLPVHRVPGGRSRTVFAYAAELDRWLAAPATRPDPPAPIEQAAENAAPRVNRRVVLAVAAFVVVALITATIAYRTRPASIGRLRTEGDFAIAYAADGRLLWRRPLPALALGVAVGSVVPRTERVDLNGDILTDAIVAYNRSSQSPDDGGGVLAALGADGDPLWTQTLEDRYTFGDREFGPPWNASTVRVVEQGNRVMTVWAAHHYTWWPSMVTLVDPRGARAGTFVNPGWIYDLAVTADQRYVLAGGVNNLMQSSVLAVLDLGSFDGTAPASWIGPNGICSNCPAGAPMKYFAVEWSELALASGTSRGGAAVRRLPSGDIQLHMFELDTAEETPELILELTPAFDVRSVAAADSFWAAHARLEREGRISHAASACPSRSPRVRVWSPGSGWRALP